MWGGIFIIHVLFIYDSDLKYFFDECWVLNEIIEPEIFIFKINTNKISIHIDVEFHRHNLVLSIIKVPSDVFVS